jgi:uncharacterized repeat protein (TIGR04076 family)
MFQVKATVIGFLGDSDRYLCHFGHKVGDEVVWDGEKYNGRLCGSVWALLVPKVDALRVAGPRYVEPYYYFTHWYDTLGIRDPSRKIYDGVGYRNVLETIVEPPYHMAHLTPPNAWKWPPHPKRTVAKDIMVTCPDTRTAMTMKLETFDLSEKGYDTTFFRRQMVILNKVLRKPEIKIGKIINEFTRQQIEEISPPLSQILIQCLVEELELMGYVKTVKGKLTVTAKGTKKLSGFKAGLQPEEIEALEL